MKSMTLTSFWVFLYKLHGRYISVEMISWREPSPVALGQTHGTP